MAKIKNIVSECCWRRSGPKQILFSSFGNIKCASILENSSALFTKVVMFGYYLLLAEVFSLKEQSCVLFLCFMSFVLSFPCWSLFKLLFTNWACPLQASV